MQESELAALLCSRLCHDLVGPVGAVGNGVEMLEMEDDPEMRGEALRLLALSARHATARLRFYRLAFGSAGGFGATLPVGEARRATLGFLAEGPVRLDWPEDALPQLPKPAMRLLLNIVLLAAEALPRGGRLAVRVAHGAGAMSLSAVGEGPSVSVAQQVQDLLAGATVEEPEPKASPARLAAVLAAGLGGRLELDTDLGRVAILARLPALAPA